MSESETSREAAREAKRKWAAKRRAQMAGLTRMQQLAHKLAPSLGQIEPYTEPERKRAEAIRARLSKIEAEAAALRREIMGRLNREAGKSQVAAKLAAGMEMEPTFRVDLAAF